MKITFKQLQGAAGEYCNGVARIDLSKDVNPGSTAIHEAIHHLYPKMLERDVLYWERKIWRGISAKDKIAVYKQLINKRTNLIIKIVKEKIG